MTVRIGADPDQSKFDLPEMSPELKDRTVRRRLFNRSGAYVREGTFICRRLRYTSQYREIPEDSSAITSLVAAPDGSVYGATSGEAAHVFVYNPAPPFDTVNPLGAIEGETDVRRSLVWEQDRSVIAGTRRTTASADGWEGGALIRVTSPGFFVDTFQEWPRGKGEFERLCVPVPGEGIAALGIDRSRRRVYGLSDRTGVLFIHDLETGDCETRGPVDPAWHFSENLIVTPAGTVLTTGAGGHLVRYDPEADRVEITEVQVPAFPGRTVYSRIDAWTLDPTSGRVYIGDAADGLLYWLDPETLETRLLGKPTDRIRVRALTAALDGRIYGMAGEPDDICQMFVYEPQTGQLRNLGLPAACIEEKRYGFEFTSAATDGQGRLYFGESERQSRLFIYFPPHLATPDQPQGQTPAG